MKISAARFFQSWVTACQSMQPQLMANWENPRGAFTRLIKSKNDCVVRRIAADLQLLCYPHDYYGIDATFYEPSDLVPRIPEGSTWLSGLSIAFEHENNVGSGLYKEVSHLLLVDAELRVLVTYPKRDGITDAEFQPVHDLIAGSRHAEKISEAENFVVILGYWEFPWEAFVYTTTGWHQLPPAKSTPLPPARPPTT